MKINNAFTIIFVSLAISACGNTGAESKGAAKEGLVINFDNCTIGMNEMSIGRLEHAVFPRGPFDRKTKKPTDEYVLYKEKLADQLFYATGSNGGVNLTNGNGEAALSLRLVNFIDGYPSLSVFAERMRMVPKLSGDASQDEFEAIFSKEIVDRNHMNDGELVKYRMMLCGKYEAYALVPTGRMPKEEKNDYYPIEIQIPLKKKGAEVNQPTKSTVFSVGMRIKVLYQNGAQCNAVMVTPGSQDSKVEYIGFCETGFINSVSEGQKMWVPNSAISAR